MNAHMVHVLNWLLGTSNLDFQHIDWMTSPTFLLMSALCLGIVAIVAWLTARGSSHRILQTLLLLPALLAMMWALSDPVMVESAGHEEPGRFVILLDNSLSMGVTDGSASRSDAVLPIVESIDQPATELLLFGQEVSAGGLPDYSQHDTDLAQAFQALRDRYAGERLSGIALITDGADHGQLRATWKENGVIPQLDLPGPLTIYAVGNQEDIVDLSVVDLSAGDFAFIRAPFNIKATIKGIGLDSQRFPVTLTRDGSLEQRGEVTLDEDGKARISFRVLPTAVGRFAYQVNLPAVDDDAVPSNDSLSVVVRVVRDRMRVLQVCGAPSPDEKFLRLFLKQDPAIDLVSFFIMRTEEDLGAGYDSHELSLIPFPYEQLFSQELWSFDLIFFQNFDYAPYFGWKAPQLLENVADYVKQGGALVMLGGDRSFDLGQYAGTAIAEILPVRLGVDGDPVDTAPFTPALTAPGSRHPITFLAADSDENLSTWSRLSPLDGLNLTSGASSDAAVLLAHPTIRAPDGTPMPVLAIRQVGKGRTMAFTSDSSWRWSFAEAGLGHGNQVYLRFWKQAMSWLVGDPDTQRVTIDTDLDNYRTGDEIRVVVTVRDLSFGPLEGVLVDCQHQGPDLQSDPVLGNTSLEATTDAQGQATFSFKATVPGSHRLKIRATDPDDPDKQAFFEGDTVVAVTSREPELADILPDHAFLAALATAQSVRLYGPGETGPALLDEEAGRWIEEDRSQSLATVPLVILVFGVFASLSWWVRRKGGAR